MSIDTTYLCRCIAALEYASGELSKRCNGDNFIDEIYHAACVKQFELVLEHSGELLRKRLAPYFASNRQVDRLHFKDLFRHATRHGLMNTETVERWLNYRDYGNNIPHDSEEGLPEYLMVVLPVFIEDAKSLAETIEQGNDG